MNKMFLAIIAIFALATNANAQIKVEGDKTATVGYMLKLKLSQLEVDDPKIKCFPDNPDWLATKDFGGQAWIIFVPGKKSVPADQKSTLYTFVIAGTKGGKTFLETHEVTVSPDGDSPTPVPVDSQLYKDLLAAYKVSPAAESKAKLTAIYEVVLEDIDNYTSFKEVEKVLQVETPKRIGNDLQNVRNTVADYFVAKVGQQGWNKAKLSAALKDVIAALKKIPD